MQFLRHSLIGLFLLSITLGLLVLAGQTIFSAIQEKIADDPRIPERKERVFAVNILKAKEETISPVLTAFGEVESRRTLEIRAKTGGTLVELAPEFEEGGDVKSGQLLARLDPADAQAALDRAESERLDSQAETREAERALILAQDELAAAQEQANLREKAYQRQLDLESRGVGTTATVETAGLAAAQARQAVLSSRQALAQAEARVDQAATRLSRARIALSEAKRRIADTEIFAGFSGTLSDVSVVTGRVVTANEQLARLIDGDALEVAFRVSTAQYVRLIDEDGVLMPAPVKVHMDTFGLRLTATGVITRDSAAVGEGQTGRLLFARLDAGNGMKPGDFVTVNVNEPPLTRAVRLPASALGSDGRVLVLTNDARLRALPVTLLRRQGDEIIVRGQDLAGQEVITERSPLLGEGIRVRVLNTSEEQAQEEANLMIDLSEDRRARLIAYIRADHDLTDETRAQLLEQVSRQSVPVQVVQRLETRMGG